MSKEKNIESVSNEYIGFEMGRITYLSMSWCKDNIVFFHYRSTVPIRRSDQQVVQLVANLYFITVLKQIMQNDIIHLSRGNV